MTVKELIDRLQEMPPDAVVIYSFHSGYTILDAEDVHHVPAESKEFILRNGGYMSYIQPYFPADETPQFADVVTLPGN